MGCLQLTYEPKFKIVHRTGELMRSHEAKSVQLWLSIDPLAEKYPNASPYNYCLGNPINLVDPDGRAPEPPTNGIPQYIDNSGVYFWDANKKAYEHYKYNDSSRENYSFSGYYKAELAEPTLSTMHEKISEKPSKGDATYIFNGVNGLQGGFTLTPDRPDYDGVITLSEANNWARNGNGEPLYADVSKLDLTRVWIGFDFKDGIESTYVNFAKPGAGAGYGQDPGLVYGTLKVSLLNRNTKEIRIGNDSGRIDVFDFDYQKGRYFRNISTFFGRQAATEFGTSTIQKFEIYGYGTGFGAQ
jgi:hypothetical protein